MEEFISKWHKELNIFCRLNPQIVLEGNVLDLYQYPEISENQELPGGSIVRLSEYLHYYLTDLGYKAIAFFDGLSGLSNEMNAESLSAFIKVAGIQNFGNNSRPLDLIDLSARAVTALAQAEVPTALILNFASRYIISPDNLSQEDIDIFTNLTMASLSAMDVVTMGNVLKNVIIVIANKVNDLPAWFYLENPGSKTIRIDTPQKEEREQFIKGENFRSFFQVDIYKEQIATYENLPRELIKIQDRFVALTEGMSFTELNDIRKLAKSRKTEISKLCQVIDLYKFGIQENPWAKLNYDKLMHAEKMFQNRIKGQNLAINRTLDIIKRAVVGLAGLQSSSLSKPKGVLFLAGPTGTGKTELAKTLSEFIFGDERSCIRFDMSEYSQSHSDQKLMGAPPGYIGYEAGGQLTNAVKKNPFSVLLFDEIEKADPSILDKFLQILEDGRMTDGQGNTIYFSETIIIFTSNLGIFIPDERGNRIANVTSSMPYEEIQVKVRTAIENYFKLQLGRPELLNRIGENIIVYDYIRESVALDIMKAQLTKISVNLFAEKNIRLDFSKEAVKTLFERVKLNLENGGRGIGNVVESMVINPLSRYIFDQGVSGGVSITIEEIETVQDKHSLIATKSKF